MLSRCSTFFVARRCGSRESAKCERIEAHERREWRALRSRADYFLRTKVIRLRETVRARRYMFDSPDT